MASLPCPPQHWSRFSTLLDAAIDLPEAARPAWLASLHGDDADIRPWLERVLSSPATGSGAFLEAPSLAAAEDFYAGQAVGPYRLEAKIGEGGMAEVWRASRQDEGPRREVALKLPHAELLGGSVRLRFRRERDVLAALSHPNIAQLYDAGGSAEDQPYLALELVKGEEITTYGRSTQATLDHRLALVQQVLGALSYAHGRLIVHRDIKPSNVLVTPEGTVKLLDFGIAKLLTRTETLDAVLTQPAGRLATPDYAAPEQLAGAPITVAADLFSVGVLLFELVTGRRPFARGRMAGIAGGAPTASFRADAVSAGIPDRRLARALRGDLDAVIAKALALDPAQRYSSAEAFERDLRRCREGMPVSARRVGWPTLAQKFIRRHRAGTAMAVILALAITGGGAGVAWQAQRATREAARANAIKDFLLGLFQQGDPRSGHPSETMTARQLLDAGADRADQAFAGDPETEIDLLTSLGDIYDALDDSARAIAVAKTRLALARRLYGAADPRVIEGAIHLAFSQITFMDREGAKAELEEIRKPVFDHYGPDSLPMAQFLSARGNALRATHGGWRQAIDDLSAAARIYGTRFPDQDGYLLVLRVLAGYLYDIENYQQSLETIERSAAIERKLGTFDPMDRLAYIAMAALDLQHLGRDAEAEKLYEDGAALADKLLGTSSQWYFVSVAGHAGLLHVRGERARADEMFQAVLAIDQSRAAATGQATSVRRLYGTCLAAEGNAAASLPLLEEALAQIKIHARDESHLRRVQGALGDAYDQLGRAREARAMLSAARDAWIAYGPPAAAATLAGRERWARFLLDHGEPEAARTEFQAVIDAVPGLSAAPTAYALAGLARIFLAKGDIKSASALSQRAVDTMQAITLQYDVRARIDIFRIRAESLAATGDIAQARDWAGRAVQAAEAYDAPGSVQLARAVAVRDRLAGRR